jgi:PhnB protein
MTNVKPVPEGYHTATPYLCCKGAAAAIEFYKKAFDAIETLRMAEPDGKIGHAEIRIGDSYLMLADEHPPRGVYGPQHYGGSPISVLLYVENADKMVEQAVAAGGKITQPLQDQFYGDRTATIADPFGHQWYIHTHIRDVSPEEMKAAMQGQSS